MPLRGPTHEMEILHEFNNKKIAREVDDAAFLLTNKRGGYIYFSNNIGSRYEGIYFNVNSSLYRVVADLNTGKKINRLINRLYCIERELKDNKETFFMPYFYNSLVYTQDKEEWVNLALDIRESYSLPVWGRFYEISEESDKLIIKYTHKNEEKNKKIFEGYVVLMAEPFRYKKIENWRKTYYERDRKRGTQPFELFIYSLAALKARKMVLTFSQDRESAIRECKHVFENSPKLEEKQRRHVEKLIGSRKIEKSDVGLAYTCCINSLDQLTTNKGIIAGLPWLFQYWTRDELISLKNMKLSLRRRILLRDIGLLMGDGRLPNKLPNIGKNIDSVGWLFKRISQNINHFSKIELAIIEDKLVRSIKALEESYVRDAFLYNDAKETWMDTSFMDAGRIGARIEIQALLLEMYRLAHSLSGNEEFLRKERNLRKRVRDRFWNGETLADGADDYTIRPNIFLSYYIYPKLLTKKEWITCFENSLKKLWLEWGGLSTIDKDSELFVGHNTGENPRSYHRGDSWYYLNNIAALTLYKVDKKKFRKYIKKILDASTKEILWMGIAGAHSEISSANKQEANGCESQAWSNSTYIELVNELFST